MKKCVLAIDLGGTNVRIASVCEDGRILSRAKSSTPTAKAEIVDAIDQLIHQVRQAADADTTFEAIGLAVPAIINAGEGRIITAPNIQDLDGFELAKIVAENSGLPTALENDATAAAIGENWMGASRGLNDSICVTLGTGVGGGIILGGRPHRGIDGTAGEVGHICVEPLGAACGCGSFGCLEQYASAIAIKRMVREMGADYPASALNTRNDITPLNVYEAGVLGDELALNIFRQVGKYLGIAFSGLINVLNPQVIVVGGGVAAGWELFIEPLQSEIEKRAFQQPANRAKLLQAVLGDDAGTLGVAKLAIERIVNI